MVAMKLSVVIICCVGNNRIPFGRIWVGVGWGGVSWGGVGGPSAQDFRCPKADCVGGGNPPHIKGVGLGGGAPHPHGEKL
jgi:hypothetical protein